MSDPSAHAGLGVSVVIPTFDCGALVAEAIASVREQSWRDTRIIVVDDGSTDDTLARLAPLAERGELTLLRVPHRGPAAARNAGVRASGDPFVAFLDADDTLAPDALRVMMGALGASPEAAFCITDAVRVHADRAELRCGRPPQEAPYLALLRGNFIERAVLFRRQALLEVGLFDESLRIFEDWDLYLRLVGAGRLPVYVAGSWYRYVVRDGSLTRDVAAIVACKEQVLAKHHRRLAEQGVPGVREVYADQMWWLARVYLRQLRRRGAALRCVIESCRFDPSPRRIVRALRTRLGAGW